MQHDAIKKKRAFSLAGQAERGEKANCLVGHFLHCTPEGMDGKGKERKGKETNKKKIRTPRMERAHFSLSKPMLRMLAKLEETDMGPHVIRAKA